MKKKRLHDSGYLWIIRKTGLQMRLLILMILGFSLTTHAKVYSQKARLDVAMSNTTISDVIDYIEGNSKFIFIYKPEDFNQNEVVNVDLQQASIHEVMDDVFANQDVDYNIYDRQIVISKANEKQPAQSRVLVNGIVADVDGYPLPGVSIYLKGTTNGTISDNDGKFSINAPDGTGVLLFSFIGMKTQEININGKNNLIVTMESSTHGLEEVVAIGYGTVRRTDVTGSISSINSDDFNSGATLAPEQLMQGKVAGVNIIQNSGQPGAASTVRIRGASSISAGNDPLYVVDGVPLQFAKANTYVKVAGESGTSPFSSEGTNPLNVINPSDIESIEILKDASATAIYGSRGANGVIIITTKSKNLGGQITYDTYVGVSTIRKTLDVLSASEYRQFAEDNGLDYPDLDANTNWQDEIFRSALSHNHSLSFGGGSESGSYRGSLGYSSQDGILLSSGIEKYTGRLNASQTGMDGKFKVDINLTYGKIMDEIAPISSNIGDAGGNILKDAIRWAPTLPVRNEDGSFYQLGELRVNPLSWAEDITDERNTNMFLGNVNLSYNILDDLKINVNMGYNSEGVNRYTSVPSDHPIAAGEDGRASISKLQNESRIIETNLSYSKDFSEASSLTVLAGYSFQRFTTENTFTAANNFVLTSIAWNLMQSGSIVSNTSYKTANRLISQYGRINYKLLDRYLFTFTLRRDGSSRFGGNNQYGLFPSGALAWKITDEPFFNVDAISNMKLRVGYGVTGNQEIPDNLYKAQLSMSGSDVYVFGGEAIASIMPNHFPNPDLQWEETSQANIGLDFGFWDNRLSGSVDLYQKYTTNLILEFETTAPSVVDKQWANVGEVKNKGFEIFLEGRIIQNNDFQWNASLNFATNKNEVITLSNDLYAREDIERNPTSGVVSNGSSTQIVKPGLELGTFWGRKFTGLDENGMETYLDADDDGSPDNMAIGSVNPDFTYGFSNNFYWKNFDVGITFRGVVGNDIYNNTAAEFSYVSTMPGVNVLKSALDLGNSLDQISEFSSRWIQDGSYLRLDNLSIGYTFDTDNISFLSKARFYVTGQNLLVFTTYEGFDPEVRTNTNRGNAAPMGIDYLSYPRPRTFLIGASFGF